MNKLLRANFARLWKSKIFWLCMIFMLCTAILAVHSSYQNALRADLSYTVNDIIFTGNLFMLIIAAVFIGLFTGTEYSDGTIRNKLVVGQSRTAVFLSNLIVCIAAVLLIHLLYIVAVICIGSLLAENNRLRFAEIIPLLLCSMAAVIALVSIFCMMSMLIHRKSHASVSLLIVAIIFLIGAMAIFQTLADPEYYDETDYIVTDEDGNLQSYHTDRRKNPYYIEGTQREIYEFLYDFLPGCQLLQIAQQDAEHLNIFPLYALSITTITTACGIFFFCKKDLK